MALTPSKLLRHQFSINCDIWAVHGNENVNQFQLLIDTIYRQLYMQFTHPEAHYWWCLSPHVHSFCTVQINSDIFVRLNRGKPAINCVSPLKMAKWVIKFRLWNKFSRTKNSQSVTTHRKLKRNFSNSLFDVQARESKTQGWWTKIKLTLKNRYVFMKAKVNFINV